MLQQNLDQVKDNRNKISVSVRRLNCVRARGSARAGQALLELALATPMLFLLIVLAIDFGGWLYAWTEVGNAARAAANYAVLGPSSAGAPVTPNATAITSMIATDLATLPHYSSTNPAVIVCWYDNGTSTSITGTCPGHSASTDDPEATSYISVYVDLNYTYTPLIPSFSIPSLNIHLLFFADNYPQAYRDEVHMSCAMRRVRDNRGQTLVEFGVCALVTVMILLAVVEFGRMVLVYTTVCNATRVGVRFAMVRGVDNPPGTGDVQTIVNSYLSAAAIDTSSVTVTTTYPGYAGTACASGSTNAGCPVEVTVSYLYQLMLSYYSFHVTLSSQRG